MMKLINVYETKIKNGIKLFRVHPEYKQIFEKIGLDNESVYYRVNPLTSGLYSDFSDADIHYSYFDESEENDYYIVKPNKTFNIDEKEFTSEQIEVYLEGLALNVSYILFCIEENNEWARAHYLEQYFEDLPYKISNLLKEYGIERF